MHTNLTRDTRRLREALYEFAMVRHIPDAQTLDDFVCRYPQFADELTTLAVDIALAALSEGVSSPAETTGAADDTVSPVVSRAMSRYHNRLYAVRQETQSKQESRTLPSTPASNPLADLDRADFRMLAKRIGGNTVLVAKLRDRLVDPETIPNSITRLMADTLEIPVDGVLAHLTADFDVSERTPQYYKAERKPGQGRRQTFVEAVKSSGLTTKQQRQLLDR